MVEFFTGDIDTGGPDTYPGSDPVGFLDNGSGLTFNYASDVGFSDQATQPAGFQPAPIRRPGPMTRM